MQRRGRFAKNEEERLVLNKTDVLLGSSGQCYDISKFADDKDSLASSQSRLRQRT